MDTMYQRGKIQEESLYYEHKKHDGSLPLIGVNTFLPKDHGGDIVTEIELIRSTEDGEESADRQCRQLSELPPQLAACGRGKHRFRTPQASAGRPHADRAERIRRR